MALWAKGGALEILGDQVIWEGRVWWLSTALGGSNPVPVTLFCLKDSRFTVFHGYSKVIQLYIYVCVYVCILTITETHTHTCMPLLNCVWLCSPRTVARQAPLSVGFRRQESRSGLPFPPPGDLPDLKIEPASPVASALAAEFFTTASLGNPHLHTHTHTYFLAVPRGMWDLSSPTWGWTCAYCRGGSVLATGRPGNSLKHSLTFVCLWFNLSRLSCMWQSWWRKLTRN